MAELVSIQYSPWSEKARWALDHHGIEYERREFVPMLSELGVRLRARRLSGKLTVPILMVDGEVLDDSYLIARWADRHGDGTPLFPAGGEREVARWNERSDQLMAAGRALTTLRVGRSAAGKRESVPPFVRGLGPLTAAVGTLGVVYLAGKYDVKAKDPAEWRAEMREALVELRSALADGREHLLDGFSYADIASAAALQFVLPVDDCYIELGPKSRELWTEPSLSKEFRDIVAWRDRVYREHR